jgi:hypothetical protein
MAREPTGAPGGNAPPNGPVVVDLTAGSRAARARPGSRSGRRQEEALTLKDRPPSVPLAEVRV